MYVAMPSHQEIEALYQWKLPGGSAKPALKVG
jgi:hypothetical protein